MARVNVGLKRKLRTLESDDEDFSITFSCKKRLKLNDGRSHQIHGDSNDVSNMMAKARARPAIEGVPNHNDDSKFHDHKEQDTNFTMFNRDGENEDMEMDQMDDFEDNIVIAQQGFLGWMKWVDVI